MRPRSLAWSLRCAFAPAARGSSPLGDSSRCDQSREPELWETSRAATRAGRPRLPLETRPAANGARTWNLAMIDPSSLFGQIDIYLFDQLLRGRIGPGVTLLDAGCGHGGTSSSSCARLTRSTPSIPTRTGQASCGPSPKGSLRSFLSRTSGRRPSSRTAFQITPPTSSSAAPFSISPETSPTSRRCFAAPGAWSSPTAGLFFCRLASSIGMETRFRPRGGR
jgi:hypothetical protein